MSDPRRDVEAGRDDYELKRQRHVQAFQARMPSEVEKLTWPLSRLWALRDERLRALVHHAKVHSPWHAERLAHVDTETLSGGDLTSVPPMTKADLMTHWDDIVTDRRLSLEMAFSHLDFLEGGEPAYLLDEYHVMATGGSTGHRAVMVWDFAGWLAANVGGNARVPILAGSLATARIGAASPVHGSAAAIYCFSQAQNPIHLFSPHEPLPSLVSALNDLDPGMLGSYPSTLHALAVEKLAGRLHARPIQIMTAGEPLLPESEALLQTAFGATICDIWGATEVGTLAASDGVNPGLVIAEDLSVIEPVDAEGRPVLPGDRADRVFVTNVVNSVLPIIRYEITDEVMFLEEPNPGPWTGRRIGHIQGRLDDSFCYQGGVVVHPQVFRSVLTEARAIIEYQVRQSCSGVDIVVRADSAIGPDLTQRIEKILDGLGLRHPAVNIMVVDRIDRHGQTGKLRRFVPLAS
ncbi:MAG: hypothetical protein MSC31_04740 [Solirubrobacteraceae bacterium MAG38_C4-C5]|nr:hypothetical protein [Candidatus Siliceabacter maunaloa]